MKQEVKPAEGKLGIMVVGCGAVATTFMTGVLMVRKGLSKPVGSMTQYDKIRVGRGAEKKYLHYGDIVPLAKLDDIVFGTWDAYPQNAYQAAVYAEVLKAKEIEPVRDELEKIVPMKAAFDPNYAKRITGDNVKQGLTRWEMVEALRQDIAEVQEKLNVQKAGWLNQKNAIDHVQELKSQLDEAKSEEERATRNGDLGRASELRYSVIPGLQQQIQDSEAALEAQKQQDGEGLNEQVTSDEIAEVVSAWTGVPVSKMMQGELDKLKGLEGELHKRVIGQDEAVSAVAAAVRRSRAGLSDPDKPIGSFFFLGPTGVGKTELAKALAECLFDDERALVRIDMSEYMEKFSVQRLIGAPPGYVGYDEGGQLTEAVRRRPYSVILLDEMEKAHPDVFNVLLQVLDDGRLTDGQGRQVSFKNTIIIMTSNVGSKAIAELSGKDEEEMRHQVDAAMAQTFRPEFLNRIDDIVVFHPLGMAQIEKIVDIQLADVRARLAKERMTLAITPAAKQMLAVGGLDPVFGARPLKRLVQREVVDAIAAAIIDGTVREGDQVTVDVDKDGGFTVVCDNTPAATYEVPDAE